MITRGVKDVVDRYINDLLAVYSQYDDGTEQKKVTQLQMRPIQLWEAVFVEKDSDRIMRTICPMHGWDSRKNKMAMLFRKLLGIAKMPKQFDYKKGDRRGIPSSQFVSVIPIGVKKDVYKKGVEQL